MLGMVDRKIREALSRGLLEMPAVALLGARQVGKTTLARSLGDACGAVYIDLESPEDCLKLSDPVAYFGSLSGKLVILDEIQRSPDLFKVLRGVIDENRRQGNKVGQFLLLGSASMDLLRQSSESLAGRIRYMEISGLNVLEFGGGLGGRQSLWLRGGFPESALAESDAVAMQWLEDLIRTYLERDIPQMGFRVPATRLRRLWTMLAHLQGEPVNHAKLGSNLEVDGKTVRHYIDILTDLLLVRRLAPWHTNVKKRLVKSPRYYVRDSGVLHRLLGVSDREALLSHPVLGKSWEGFVMENIHSILPRDVETYYYRTAVGAEIDLVIKWSTGETWAVEIKHGSAPKLGKYFSQSCEDVGASQRFVVYGGEDEFPVANGVTVIGLERFLLKIGR